jgi:hypothetical protein
MFSSLRTASISCLAIWAAIWLLFLSLRFSTLDVTGIPGAGLVLLGSLVAAVLAPIVATGLAAAALFRQPRVPLNWMVLGCSTAVLLGQALLFFVTSWM